MSQNVEEKITRMVFDHDKFDKGVEKTIYELNKLTKSIGDLAGATKTVQALETVASKLSFASIANGVGEASRSFTDLQIVGISVLDAIRKPPLRSLTPRISSCMPRLVPWKRSRTSRTCILHCSEAQNCSTGYQLL